MPDNRGRYDSVPPIPSYDEAIADGGAARWPPSPVDGQSRGDVESQSLLTSHRRAGAPSSSRGYRPPTVETDDEDSLFGSDYDDADETAYVRREMQELEIGEPENGSRSSLWGKRIPFSLSLPSWKWSWKWRLPRLRRTIRLPSGPGETTSATSGSDGDTSSTQTARRRCRWPSFEGLDAKRIALVMARIFAVLIVIGVVYLLFMSDVFNSMARHLGTGFRFNPEDVRIWTQSKIQSARMRASVRHYTSYAHLAGSEGDYATAMDMESMFSRAGMDSVHIDEYNVYLNYPKVDGRAVELLEKDGKKVAWKAKLEEKDPGSEKSGRQTLAFHGHSKSGVAQGPLIYANHGLRKDFARLKDMGIDTKGGIALMRHQGMQSDPGLMVKAAEMAGFVGCLIYTDPASDGSKVDAVAPEGHNMPKDAVRRDSVSMPNWVVGDVLTPGWGSKDGLPRMKVDQTRGLNGIPSLPLSWRDAQVLLQHLNGKGKKSPAAWHGDVPDVKWWTGGKSSPIVRLKNEQDEERKQAIWNVYGKIEGMEQPEKSVIVGNHRDSLAFGATDPHSGTAVMVETARVLGMLMTKGWRPLRSIEFMSWDAADYNFVGSTEYVETNQDKLRRDAVAYINLDGAVSGNEFHASGSPVFQRSLHRVLDRISDPNRNATLRELWDGRGADMGDLGMDSDYIAFRDIAGTNSIDLQFRGPPYPARSSYNNFEWVERVGDPGFVYHGLMGQILALLILELADRPIVPFDMVRYGDKLDKWVGELQSWAEAKIKDDNMEKKFTIDPLKIAVHEVKAAAKTFADWENVWDSLVLSAGGWESAAIHKKRVHYNERVTEFESALLDLEQGGGIPNRTQFKHVVFGPRAWSSDDTIFPAIRDAIQERDWDVAAMLVKKASGLLRNAANILLDKPHKVPDKES